MTYAGQLILLSSLSLLAVAASACRGPCDASYDPECVYRYVMVRDRTNPSRQSETGTAGADIYGITLFHDVLEEQIRASSVVACEFGGADNGSATNCDYAMGVGESSCFTEDSTAINYVSLGGMGGYVIAVFNNEIIDKNDYVRVYECPRRKVGDRKYDHFDIYVGVSTDPEDPSWVLCRDWATHRTDCQTDFKEPVYQDLSWYDPENLEKESD